MNMKLIKIFAAMLCFLLTCCNEDETDWNNPPIKYSKKGIDFMFCLLDESGNPSTKFKEGENFSFYFKMTTNRKDKLYILRHISGLHCNPDLGDVKTLNNKTIKYPITRSCDFSLTKLPFYGDDIVIEMIFPWDSHPESEDFGSIVNIPKGKYYTDFRHVFEFLHENNTHALSIGPLYFKIYFEII